MARHVLMTPHGPVDASFSWFSWTTATAAPHAGHAGHPGHPGVRRRIRRGLHADAEVTVGEIAGTAVLPPLPVRPRRSPERPRDLTPDPDRPDLDTLRRVLAALYRL